MPLKELSKGVGKRSNQGRGGGAIKFSVIILYNDIYVF